MKAPGRRLLSILAYPAVMTGVMALALAGLRAGVSPPLVIVPLLAAVALIVLLLELALPYREAWSRSHGDTLVDLALSVLGMASSEPTRLLLAAILAAPTHLLASAVGASPWPTRWPLLAQLALALVLSEFGVYWIHRLQHRGGLLWRLHAVHHSAPRLYWLNNGRNHPLDVIVTILAMMAPLVLLGAGPDVITLLTIFATSHAFFQHSNTDLHLGPLNWILSAPEVHRFHHSRALTESNANYGQTLLVWDIIFRTRHVPRDTEPPTDTGLHDSPDFPTSLTGQLASPFRSALFTSRDHD
ncbi:MAG: sterol desaturase family protein [Byssovorax sp.]